MIHLGVNLTYPPESVKIRPEGGKLRF
jgi:hypothetical protein